MSTTTNTPVYPSIFSINAVLDDAGKPTGKMDIDLVFATGDKSYTRQVSVDGQTWWSINVIPPNTTWYGGILLGVPGLQQVVYRFVPQ